MVAFLSSHIITQPNTSTCWINTHLFDVRLLICIFTYSEYMTKIAYSFIGAKHGHAELLVFLLGK